MLRRLFIAALTAAAVPVSAALADGGPSPGVLLGGAGVLSVNGAVRYVTLGTGASTLLEAVRTTDGFVLRARPLVDGWGIPSVAYDGTAGGLSRNSRTLVLSEATFGTPLRTQTRFQIVRPKTLGYETIALKGDFAFDALSPNGRRLYLIEHVSATNLSRYLVRAYDLEQRRLLPGAIADRTQRGWVMQGSPIARVSSSSWRFVYTLYQNPGGYPFVHALDTARGAAHCIGLSWTGDQSPLSMMHLFLRNGGRTLAVSAVNTTPFFTIDTHTYRVSVPTSTPGGPFPWWVLSFTVPVLLAAALLAPSRSRLALLSAMRLRRRTAPA